MVVLREDTTGQRSRSRRRPSSTRSRSPKATADAADCPVARSASRGCSRRRLEARRIPRRPHYRRGNASPRKRRLWSLRGRDVWCLEHVMLVLDRHHATPRRYCFFLFLSSSFFGLYFIVFFPCGPRSSRAHRERRSEHLKRWVVRALRRRDKVSLRAPSCATYGRTPNTTASRRSAAAGDLAGPARVELTETWF